MSSKKIKPKLSEYNEVVIYSMLHVFNTNLSIIFVVKHCKYIALVVLPLYFL